jgi:hypothetical protein
MAEEFAGGQAAEGFMRSKVNAGKPALAIAAPGTCLRDGRAVYYKGTCLFLSTRRAIAKFGCCGWCWQNGRADRGSGADAIAAGPMVIGSISELGDTVFANRAVSRSNCDSYGAW